MRIRVPPVIRADAVPSHDMSHGSGHGHHHDGDESWDERAPEYARTADRLEPGLKAATDSLLDAAHAGPGVRLLDLACGPGHTTAAAQARGAIALGIDRSRAMVEQARQRFPTVSFAVGDMARPPVGPWDAIVCRFGAHHADPAWLRAAFQVLRSGGRLAVAENEPLGDHDHGGKAPAREWQRRLEDAGFGGVAVQALSLRVPTPGNRAGDGPAESAGCIVSGRKP